MLVLLCMLVLQALKRQLNEALKMLNIIQASYSTFQKNMIQEAKKLPASLEPELDLYDNAICHHLGVVRQNLKPSQSVCAYYSRYMQYRVFKDQ